VPETQDRPTIRFRLRRIGRELGSCLVVRALLRALRRRIVASAQGRGAGNGYKITITRLQASPARGWDTLTPCVGKLEGYFDTRCIASRK
jgi:hypothetical protein